MSVIGAPVLTFNWYKQKHYPILHSRVFTFNLPSNSKLLYARWAREVNSMQLICWYRRWQVYGVRKRTAGVCVCSGNLKTEANLIPNKHFRHSQSQNHWRPITKFTFFPFFTKHVLCLISLDLEYVCVMLSFGCSKNTKKTNKFQWWCGVKNEFARVCVFVCMRFFGRYTSGGMRFWWKIV